MPVRKGTCINFGPCPKADAHAVIEIQEGEEFVCPFPGCRKPLQPLTTRRRGPKPGAIIAGCLGALIVVIGLGLWQPWRPSVPMVPPPLQPVVPPTTNPIAVDKCDQTDWAKAKAPALLVVDCKGIPAYDRRLAYITSLNATNWVDVKPKDPRLRDCAGIQACEERARHYLLPPPPPPPGACAEREWAKSSCEEVKECWQGEDPRLSTPTCGGLSKASCSHIQQCLGLHPLNVGPGNSPD